MKSGSPDKKAFARQVVERLRANGFVAFWAGGCVRDMLLDREPQDYDVATDAVPDQVRDLFGHRQTLAIGAAFGVVAVRGPRGAGQVEVATFREDHGYSNGRRPDSVSFSSPEEDAQRRDFTINGMFYDPVAHRTIDYVSGTADLAAGIVRAIGDPDQRFAEDKLRMLRAVRFATTLGFQLDPPTANSIVRHADQILVVSGERIAMELERMLCHVQRGLALQMLRDTGLLGYVLSEFQALGSDREAASSEAASSEAASSEAASSETASSETASSETWSRKLQLLAALENPTWAMVLAVLAAAGNDSQSIDRSARQLRSACRRLRLSNATTERAIWLLQHESLVRRSRQLPWAEVQPLLIHPGCDELLKLAEAIAFVTSSEDREGVAYCRGKRALPASQLDPSPLISGNDLLELGVPRGPQYAQLLGQVRVAQLEQRICSREEALAWVDHLRRGTTDAD